jgi:hypothetical protein
MFWDAAHIGEVYFDAARNTPLTGKKYKLTIEMAWYHPSSFPEGEPFARQTVTRMLEPRKDGFLPSDVKITREGGVEKGYSATSQASYSVIGFAPDFMQLFREGSVVTADNFRLTSE